MPFTPDEVEHKTFLTTLRGYDKAEVAAFLRAVAEEMRTVAARSPEPEAPVLLRELRRTVEESGDLLSSAQADARQLREQAWQQAEEITTDAATTAERTHREAVTAAAAMVAEAERRADEITRSARSEAAGLLEQARTRAQGLLRAAEDFSPVPQSVPSSSSRDVG